MIQTPFNRGKSLIKMRCDNMKKNFKALFDSQKKVIGYFLSSNCAEIIEVTAAAGFDFVIIDTAPCGILADAAIVAGYADTSVIVVKQDCAPARKIKRAIDNIENSGIEILGCIYNNAERSFGKPSFYGKKSGYDYGYGYGYSYGGSSANSKHNDKQSR